MLTACWLPFPTNRITNVWPKRCCKPGSVSGFKMSYRDARLATSTTREKTNLVTSAAHTFEPTFVCAFAVDVTRYKFAERGDLAYNMMRMWQGAVGVVPTDGL